MSARSPSGTSIFKFFFSLRGLGAFLAFGIALIGDLADFTGILALPVIGDGLDVFMALSMSILLLSPLPLIGLVELAPIGVADLSPTFVIIWGVVVATKIFGPGVLSIPGGRGGGRSQS